MSFLLLFWWEKLFPYIECALCVPCECIAQHCNCTSLGMWALVNDRLFNQYIDNRDELVKTLAGVKTELKAPLGDLGKWLLKDENIPLPEGRLMVWRGTVACDVRLLLSKILHPLLSTTLILLPGNDASRPRRHRPSRFRISHVAWYTS